LLKGHHFSPNQVVALTFAVLILTGALLLMLPFAGQQGEGLSFVDALFTATSASCVTGLVVVDTGTYFSTFGQIVLIALIQAGGLGLMLFATLFSVATGRKINLQDRMYIQASLNQDDMAGVVRMSLKVAKYTAAVELVFGALLSICFVPSFGLKGIYYGFWHAISAFCNAGFDLFGHYSSLTGFTTDVPVNLIISALVILGGIGFPVMSDVLEHRGFSRLRLHTKLVLVTTAFLLIAGTVLIEFLEADNAKTLAALTPGNAWLASFFQSMSTRTAGFNTIDLVQLRSSTLLVMIVLMVIGASPASTGGGIKTTTFALLVLSARQVVQQKSECTIFGRRIDSGTIFRAFAIATMSMVWIFFEVIGITYLEDTNFLYALFEVASAYATVGLSTGLSQHLTTGSKLILIISMYAGRVGIMTFAMSLTARRNTPPIRYPEEKIIVG
jgi:trk system potassium uptake protein TrkH